jgi:glycosyltransferase involved in cell wall biosynthesis
LLEKSPIRYDVISTSRLVSWKNVDVLIQATSIAGLRLAIAGDGPERDALQELTSRLGADVVFLGELSTKEIQKVLAESKIYALISSYEGMSFGLLEAMMQEMLILVSDIPANTALIKNGFNGLVAEDSNPTSIAQQLVSLLDESSSSLSINARKTALSQFSETKIFEKYIELMSDAIE